MTSVISQLRSHRERAGLSQAALAKQVGVSRQALIAIEASRQVPSTALALQLSRALGCAVEDLFALASSGGIHAELAPALEPGTASSSRVVLARLGERVVAHRIAQDSGLAADGVVTTRAAGDSAVIDPWTDPTQLPRHVLVAGCAPMLGILAQRTARRNPDVRVTWLASNNSRSLDLLEGRFVHIAGLHLRDGDEAGNHAELRRRFPQQRMLVVNLAGWQQGFVVPKTNPQRITSAQDLLRPGLRFAGREEGAGARDSFSRLVSSVGAEVHSVDGPRATGHSAVAQLVRAGAADVGIAIESAAIGAGLDFVPLCEESFDLVMPTEHAELKPVAQLIEHINEASFRREAAQLVGYDLGKSGQVTTLHVA